MSTSAALRQIFAAGRPLIEQWLDVAEQIAALRDTATASGLDWSQVKALLKAQIQDERDERGDGKRVRRIVEKAEFASAYADILGLAKMNEQKYSASHDPETGEVIETGSVGPRKAADTKPDERLADKSSSPIQESREDEVTGVSPALPSEAMDERSSETAAITSEPAPSTVPDDAVGEPAPAALVSPPFSSDDEPELPSFCDRRNWVDGRPPAKAEAA